MEFVKEVITVDIASFIKADPLSLQQSSLHLEPAAKTTKFKIRTYYAMARYQNGKGVAGQSCANGPGRFGVANKCG